MSLLSEFTQWAYSVSLLSESTQWDYTHPSLAVSEELCESDFGETSYSLSDL